MLGTDRTAKRVTLASLLDDEAGELMSQRDLEYDTLIIAIGSTTAFFGVQGAQENSLSLDAVDQAELFRKRLIAACIRAEYRAPEPQPASAANAGPRQPRIQVAIVGGSATGVLAKLDGLATNRLGQLIVPRTLQTETDDNIFALGDCAACPWPGGEKEGRNVPPRAQAASAGKFPAVV